ncbi:deazaflavin-dependent oxidoreductase (nitroreductase family) [Friedmanniella endophytica]|uniref:Deazaflavin-dependent oxidoreductase (Nitroreductase family) n=1 Tax=Microlunatus kandeliicorticis TaxID=1759536 RepID=A0A7W3IRY0_9ACTN|nr:nitroreductase family deazaflavin-dependent oxidoreductase [Microlunatus kandeliicorticis]MBA8794090.1 deazaflavin-dependent oxidoreductase (nitroreductase family) [Microlunatus kandeliicorticis]
MTASVGSSRSVARLGAALLRQRWFVRAPILLYRWHLGALVGDRVLLLEHLGRRSGQWRTVCLEVVDRPAPSALVVISGFGRRSQWFRNLQANPVCRLSVGRLRRVDARAVVLSEAQTTDVLARYADRHPAAWRRLRDVLTETLDAPTAVPPAVRLELCDLGSKSRRI